MEDTIFIQIASYRDPELLPTIMDCLEKARNPHRLRFGICWQNCKDDKFDDLSSFQNDERFRILDINYQESLGCCWARHNIQKLWEGETYTLQIDSHMRFHPNWDSLMIDYLHKCESDKPIISIYPNAYEYDSCIPLSIQPAFMRVLSFDDDCIPTFQGDCIQKNWMLLRKPIPGRFLAAGFIFTLGKFCQECVYDPEIYFRGEEISLAARSYTHGYDIFHPHKNIIWHLYNTPKVEHKRSTHWKDHSEHIERDKESRNRIKKLFGIGCEKEDLGLYGFGKERTLEEYLDYAGIDLANKKVLKEFEHASPTMNDYLCSK